MKKYLTVGTLIGVASAGATLAGVFGQPEISALLSLLASEETIGAINTTMKVVAACGAVAAGLAPGVKKLAK